MPAGCCVLATCSATLAGAPVTLSCCLVSIVVVPRVVWVKRQNSVRHSTRGQPLLQWQSAALYVMHQEPLMSLISKSNLSTVEDM